jgi:uncharacterized damage-inducible protein DinB
MAVSSQSLFINHLIDTIQSAALGVAARGAAMFAYMVSHEADHRGEACMLAQQLGFPLPIKAAAGIRVQEKLGKQCGFARPR